MNSLRPATKIGAVVLGLLAAFGIAWLAAAIRQATTQGPEAQATSGMYAAGDAMLCVLVFGLLALVPLAFGLYWLRPVAMFWSVFAWSAVSFAATAFGALVACSMLSPFSGTWPVLLAELRLGLTPLTALAMFVSGLFAPQRRARGMLLAAAASDAAIFAGVVLVKFILPNLQR